MRNPIGLALEATLLTPHSAEETIRVYREAGMESFFCDSWDKDLETMFRMRETAERVGMLWTSVHAPFRHSYLLWEDGEDTQAEIAMLEETIDRSAKVGIPLIVLHPFIGFSAHRPNEAGIRHYRRLLDRAGERGVLLAIENVERIEFLDFLLTRLKDHPALRFCLDTGHELCYNGGVDLLSSYGDLLGYLHIDSNMGKLTKDGDPHCWHDDAHMLPYDGAVDMGRLVRNLARLGYEGPLTLEMVRGNREGRHTNDAYLALSDEEYLARCVERATRLRSELEALRSKK